MNSSFAVMIAAALIILGSCSHATDANGNDNGTIEKASSVISQSIAVKGGSSVTFTLRASWPNSCGQFSHADVGQAGSLYSIKIFGKQPADAVCAQVLSSFTTSLTIELPAPGAYRFRFWQSDTTNIDTTFVVK